MASLRYILFSFINFLGLLHVLEAEENGKMSISPEYKSSIANLFNKPNNAHFGKSFFLLLDVNQTILTGHSDEDYKFDYWLGKMRCGTGFDQPCNPKICGVLNGATVFCNEAEKVCQCSYDQAVYPSSKCDAPKFVFSVENHYYDINGNYGESSSVLEVNFVAFCRLDEGDSMPIAPEPYLDFKVPTYSDGRQGLELTISWSTYVPISGLNAYFWTVNSVFVRINFQSLGLALDRLGAKQMARMLDDEMVKEIAKIKGMKIE